MYSLSLDANVAIMVLVPPFLVFGPLIVFIHDTRLVPTRLSFYLGGLSGFLVYIAACVVTYAAFADSTDTGSVSFQGFFNRIAIPMTAVLVVVTVAKRFVKMRLADSAFFLGYVAAMVAGLGQMYIFYSYFVE